MTPLEEKMCLALENYFFSRNRELWICTYKVPKCKKIAKKEPHDKPLLSPSNLSSFPTNLQKAVQFSDFYSRSAGI